jgi:protein TonB
LERAVVDAVPLTPSPRAHAALRPLLVAGRPRRAAIARSNGARWPAIAAIATAHVAVLYALLVDRLPVQPEPRRAVQVELIAASPAPEPPKPAAPPRAPARLRHAAPQPVESPPPAPVAAQAPPSEPIDSASAITLAAAPAPAVSPPVVHVAAVTAAPLPVIPPRYDAAYLDNPAPAYPALARRQREEGRVLLRVLVGADGRAERVEIATSSGFERLDRAAQEAVRRWRFVPAKRGDEAIAAYVAVPIVFTLDRA